MRRFEGKVALVTGGNSGLGKATAEAFAREGAKVVLAARREALGREVEAAIRAAGGEATFVACDVSNEEQVRALVERTVQLYGRLDYAYNNAGAKPAVGAIAEFSTSDYDEIFTVCLRGVFLCMKYEIPAMIAGGGGAIVNCSSVACHAAVPGFGPYVAAKAGLEALTRTAAHECVRKNIRVNSICPGSFDTPMSGGVSASMTPEELEAALAQMPMGRPGRPEELATAVLYLCSESAAFITGTDLVMDGGFLLT